MRPLPVKIFHERDLNASTNQKLVNGLIIFLSICAILFFGQAILIPIVLSILLSILLSPLVRILQKVRVPRPAAIMGVVLIAFALLFGVAAVVAATLNNLAGDLPRYETNLRDKAKNLKLVTSGGGTMEKAANVLQDLQNELQKPAPSPGTLDTAVKAIPVEVRQSTCPGSAPMGQTA